VQHSPFSPANLQAVAHRQLMTYWRVRVHKTLEQLETETRRMLRVESGLEQFAQQMVVRLQPYMALSVALPAGIASGLALPQAPFAWVEKGVGAARAAELKQRYRQLAKDLHPDAQLSLEGKPSMAEVNHAYATGDLAALVRMEAMVLAPTEDAPTAAFEDFVRQVEQATQTYRQAYAQLLNSPLYALYARAASAQEDGWDFVESLTRRIKRAAESAAANSASSQPLAA